MEGTCTPAVPRHGSTYIGGQFAEGSGVLARCQGIEVAIVDPLRDLGAAGHVGYTFAHRTPGWLTCVVALCGPVDLEAARVIDGGLGAQHRPLLVVDLDRVSGDIVLEPDPLGAVLEIARDLAGEVPTDTAIGGQLLAEEAQHVSAPKPGDPVLDQPLVELGQRALITEHDVSRPLALIHRPVVVERAGREDLLVRRMRLRAQQVQRSWPADLQLLIHQALGVLDVGDPGEAVLATLIGDALAIERARQPLATVEPDLDLEREPGLYSDVHEAEHGMLEVVVQVQALALLHLQLELLGFAVAMQPEAEHRFN